MKVLINVKESVESVQKRNDEIVLQLDCLDESLKMFQHEGIAKDSQIKNIRKLFEEWNHLKKLAKETKKEILPFVQNETDKNNSQIKKLEEDLKVYTAELKKRDFYQFKTGVEISKQKLESVGEELKHFDDKIEDLGYNAESFGNPDLITNSQKSVENIKHEILSMNTLWTHIDLCLTSFETYLEAKWLETDPMQMEDEVKKL